MALTWSSDHHSPCLLLSTVFSAHLPKSNSWNQLKKNNRSDCFYEHSVKHVTFFLCFKAFKGRHQQLMERKGQTASRPSSFLPMTSHVGPSLQCSFAIGSSFIFFHCFYRRWFTCCKCGHSNPGPGQCLSS